MSLEAVKTFEDELQTFAVGITMTFVGSSAGSGFAVLESENEYLKFETSARRPYSSLV